MNFGHYGFSNILELVRAVAFRATGKPGATAGAAFAGGTTSGAPTSGSFDQGDVVVGQDGHVFVCTVAGSPGTWTDAGTAGGLASPLSTKGDLWGWSSTNARVGVGADGAVLRADSTQSTGLAWMAGSGPRVVSTSASGAVSDADLAQGSSTFGTDNTTVLQAVLDLASSAPLLVIWDGHYSTTGLVLHDNTTILFLPGCGAILRNASNKPVFANDTPTWGTALSPQNSTISLLGPGIVNGNGANQTFWSSATGYLPALRFWGVATLHIADLCVYNARVFALHLVNCRHVRGERVRIDNGGAGTAGNGQDGWHLNGPCDDVVLRDTVARTSDDHIALNADDGSATSMGITGVAQGHGPITNVTIDGLLLDSAQYFGMRLLSGASLIDNVTIRRVRGTIGARWLVVGNFPGNTISGAGSGNVGRVLVEDCQVAVTGSRVGDGSGDIVLNGAIDHLTVRSVRRVGWADAYPLIDIPSGSVAHLCLEDLLLEDTDAGNFVTPTVHVGAPVTLLELRGVALTRGSLSAVNAALVRTAANVSCLRLIGVTADRTTRVVDQVSGALTTVDAVAVRHTNAGGGSTFALGGTTVGSLVLSNYDGARIYSGTAPTATSGDAFDAGGTVTSVGLSMPAEYSVASSPVTGSGTLAVTKATQAPNLIYSGPSSGSAAVPTFRALEVADLPAGVGQASSLLMILPNPNSYVVDGTSDEQPPDFITLATGDVIGVGGM